MAENDLESAFGKMESGKKGEAANDNSSSGGKHEDSPGELHAILHTKAGGKHHVTKHSGEGVESLVAMISTWSPLRSGVWSATWVPFTFAPTAELPRSVCTA